MDGPIITEEGGEILVQQYWDMDWKHFDEYKAFLFQGRVLWKGNDGQWKCTCKEFGKDFYCVDSVAVNHGTSIRIIPKDFRKRYNGLRYNYTVD